VACKLLASFISLRASGYHEERDFTTSVVHHSDSGCGGRILFHRHFL